MLSWLFKKRAPDGATHAGPAPVTAPPPRAEARAQLAADARAEWLPQLQAAQGDDAALLRIAQATPLLDIKLAAVEALGTEDALKQAERALRSHDSRAHRAAKKRLVAAVALREARARATELIDTASALAAEALPAANRLVALDHDWQALDASLLSAAQCEAFAERRDQINTSIRAHGEHQHRVHRWVADATRALDELRQSGADDIVARSATAQRLRDTRPDAPTTTALDAALHTALQAAALAEEARLTALAMPAASAPSEPTAVEPTAPVATPAPTTAPTAVANRPSAEQRQQVEALLGQAEAALAAGQFGEMQQQLRAVDHALESWHGAAVSNAMRARHQALHAERARLKGWQQWGGGRAIDALVDDAEALARLTLAANDADAVNPPKLALKAHAENIRALRLRWKELERLGAAANQTLWQRFDTALQSAHAPVAAQQAALKAARQDNLRAREALLIALDDVPVEPAAIGTDDLAAHWKEQLRALGDFQLAWRQLGPLEHTVPRSAKDALLQRLRSGVERIEVPLQEARRGAEAVREQLIARADALARELGHNPALRDAAPRVRELQAEWQQAARTVPLARAVESALWARFKAATDAAFAQRAAAFDARDAELAANLAAREALLERLSSVSLDADAAELQRALNDVDRAWRQPIELPRAAAGAIEARFREARTAVAQALADSAQRGWQVQCDTLLAKLRLCESRESSEAAPLDEAERAREWAAHAALPAAWEQALAARWTHPVAPGPLAAPAVDDLLLQLEAALDLLATPEMQAARRELKLRALKDTLEGRATSALAPAAQRAQWLAAALRQGGLAVAQRERLHAVIAALRQTPPGANPAGTIGR